MEGKGGSSSCSSSVGDEFSQWKSANPPAASVAALSSSSSPGYFSTFIPPASAVISKDLSHSDLCWTLNKQRAEARIASARRSTAGKSQGSPSKRQISHNKDGKPLYPNESIESPNFCSSVHYGTRDFYASTSSTQTSKTLESNINDGGNPDKPHAADRGEWWQGSLYY